uniref:CBFA2/RUNX1 partner transcriptional co-repressor 3 n=1 Tax=Acanthochromis polyacanthus TaxID=80966 RepID=A0A3Q1EAP9_9TELE
TGSRVQKVGTMPDSPADVKTQPRSTPPTMPPPPPAVSQATNLLNGSSHSPTSLNGAPSTPNGFNRDGLHPEHLAKRPCTISPSQRFSPSTGLPAHPPPNVGPQHYRLEDMALAHQYRDAYRHNEHRDARDRHRQSAVHGARQEEVIDHRLTDREWAEEWKHLDNLLNCIMDMVEKTRRSLTVLRRCQEADREEMNHWIRRYSDVEEMKKGGKSSSSSASRSTTPATPALLDATSR